MSQDKRSKLRDSIPNKTPVSGTSSLRRASVVHQPEAEHETNVPQHKPRKTKQEILKGTQKSPGTWGYVNRFNNGRKAQEGDFCEINVRIYGLSDEQKHMIGASVFPLEVRLNSLKRVSWQ